jgi:hypothetical protein
VWEWDAGPDSAVDNWLVTVEFGYGGTIARSWMAQS